ncbi:MAG: hypothetical protein ABSD46_06050 [Bacteroidota bacterium]
MMISTLDLIIILSYFFVTITLGILVSKRAIKNLNSYFLGSNSLPWGFWKPILKKVRILYPDFQPNRNFTHDLFNVLVGVLWQTSLVTIPIALVTQQHLIFTIALSIMLSMSVALKFTWWNKLDKASEETLPTDFDQRIKVKALS